MPQTIALQPVANQSFNYNFGGNTYGIILKAVAGIMAASITINGVDIIDNVRCVAWRVIIPSQYEENGNFMFWTTNLQLPWYTQFGLTQTFVYISPTELADIRANNLLFSPFGAAPLRFCLRITKAREIMPSAFNSRLVKLTIQTQGQTYEYDQQYFIRAQGEKLASPLMSPCEFRIDNINRDLRNYLLTACSPFSQQNYQNKTTAMLPFVTLDVGRTSFAPFRMFQGNCIAVAPTQPPDIGITLKTMQNIVQQMQPYSMTQPQNITLKTLAGQIAGNLGLSLEFTATDKQIGNFSFTGTAYTQVSKLAECGNIDVFVDNQTLVVKDQGTARQGGPTVINSQTGMVTVPVVNEYGIQLRSLINSEIKIGGAIEVQSSINPAANGTWYVYRLNYDISTWETPFYWNIYARLVNQFAPVTTP